MLKSFVPAVRLPAALVGAFAVLALLALSAAPAHAALGDRTLAKGARGGDVKELQKLLRRAGFAMKVDGVYGSGTYRKVRQLEQDLGLNVDGRVSSADVEQVEAALAPSATAGGFSADSLQRPRAVSAQEATGEKAELTPDGLAIPPAGAPEAVKQIIAAGNEIASTPYKYGGGHGKWKDTGYDCSGSVSYALHGAGLLDASMPSGGFTSWGDAGEGQWVTIYAHGSHMYMVVAGLRFDTSGRAKSGSRWQEEERSPSGFTVRHPEGL